MNENPDDVILWPDGCWCRRSDLHEFTWKSDDYEVIPEDEWEERNAAQ